MRTESGKVGCQLAFPAPLRLARTHKAEDLCRGIVDVLDRVTGGNKELPEREGEEHNGAVVAAKADEEGVLVGSDTDRG